MVYRLGAGSLAELKGVHPSLVSCVNHAIANTQQDFVVMDGLRTLAEQTLLVRKGKSKTMNSKHRAQADGFSHAVDLVPYIDGRPQWVWDMPGPSDAGIFPIVLAMRAASIAIGVPLIWGGIWDRKITQLAPTCAGLRIDLEAYKVRHAGADFLDGPHYQLC